MIAADNPAIASPVPAIQPSSSTTAAPTSLFGRLGALLTRAAHAAADDASDASVWTSIARGL